MPPIKKCDSQKKFKNKKDLVETTCQIKWQVETHICIVKVKIYTMIQKMLLHLVQQCSIP
jgi:hypothetical protein